MNKIYRFNRPLTIASLVAAALLATANPLQALDPNALPTGGQVVAGQANISQAGNAMTVNQQTDRMIANWNTFNIGRNASVAFQQPGASSVALNRIFDQNPSQIFGSLSANGQVFLLNTAGVYFGPTAQVDVGGLVASSLNLSNENFLAGKYHFENTGIAGSIINQGQIRTAEGGYVAFLSPGIINEGTISTPGGTTALAAGDKVSLDFTGDRLVTFTVDQGAIDAQIKNKGLIKADGGLVMMTAKAADELTRAVVNNEGVVEAQTLENRSGRILLLADMESGETIVGGRLDASAPYGGDGGFIETSAAKVTIRDGAQITTFAPNGKTGTWLIDPNDFTIAASGGDITGSQLSTNLGGGNVTILSSNGATAGNGDIFVNDSITWSVHTLTLNAHRNIEINSELFGSGTAQLALAYGQGAGDGVISGTTAFYSIHAPVNLPAGNNFSTRLGSDGVANIFYVITQLGAAGSATGTDLQGMAGNLSGQYALGADIDVLETSGWNGGAGFAPIGDNSTDNNNSRFTGKFDGLGHTISGLTIDRPTTDYVGLFGWTDGAAISNVGITGGSVTGKGYVGGLVGYNNNSPITNSYATGEVTGEGDGAGVGGLVGYNENSTITNSYATGKVSAIGDYTESVGGLVGGNDNSTITNSYATGAVTGEGYSVGGLVGWNNNSTIEDSHATGKVSATGADAKNVGGLVGYNESSTIEDSHATGEVSATGANAKNVGGLVGKNEDSTIEDSHATGEVTGRAAVGGLVGYNESSTITNSYAKTGAVTGIRDFVGGLVGINTSSSTITNSYATGAVWAIGEGYVGGLVGKNEDSTIEDSHATGSVTGKSYVGGLVGYNENSPITNSYAATGEVKGEGNYVGGLVGSNLSSSTITNSSAAGEVTGGYYVGGLVGWNEGSTITNSSATGEVKGGGDRVGGLVGSNLSSSTITNSSAAGEVTGRAAVGGLVGYNESSTIEEDSHATGNVTGSYYVGGLVGHNNLSTITNSYATGAVLATGVVLPSPLPDDIPLTGVGGLVGYNENSTITNSHATGDVTGEAIGAGVGGLVGGNDSSTITNSYAKGVVTGNIAVGGLVGGNVSNTIITESYATGKVEGYMAVGGLVGANLSSTDITNSYATGAVEGDNAVGGLVGAHNDGSTITNSYATGAVKGGSEGEAGGLVGSMGDGGYGSSSGSAIENSYATGVVEGERNVGGLVGRNYSDSAIKNSYATGKVTGDYSVGGLVGGNNDSGTITNSYATGKVEGDSDVGGLVGYNSSDSTITNSFWDKETSGQSGSAGGEGLTTDKMKKLTTFAGWDIDDAGGTDEVWRIYEDKTYPLLRNFLTPATATVSGDLTKVYDASTTVSGGSHTWDITVDESKIYGTAVYTSESKNVGNWQVTLTGLFSEQQGYDIDTVNGAVTITPYDLKVTGLSASNKVYDAGTVATLTGTAAITKLGSDDVTLGGTAAGAFADKHVGTAKAVTVTGNSISGTDAGNYNLIQQAGLTADITPYDLNVTGLSASNKTYDAGTVATLTGTAAITKLGTDDVTLGGTAEGAFANKNVGTGKAVTVTGNSISGTDAGNYNLIQQAGLTADITPYDLNVTGLSASNKVYDAGTVATLTGTAAITKLGTDDVTLGGTAEGAFANKNVGTGKAVTVTGNSISGTDAGNYNLIQQAGLTADITKADLTVTANDISKTYGQEITFAGTEFTGNGLVGGETIGLVQLASSGASATAVVAGSLYVITASDASGGTFLPANYNITYQNGALTVNKAALTVTANDDKKTFDNLPYTGGNGVVYAGFVNGENEADLGGALDYSGSSQGAIQGGTYNIDPLGLTSVNYALTFKNGILTIEVPVVPVPVVVDPVAINRQNSNDGNDPAAPNTFALGAGQGSQNIGMASVMAESSSIDAVIYTPTFSAPVTLSSAGQTTTLTVGGATSAGPMTDVGSLPVFTSSGNAAPSLQGTFMLQQSGNAVSLTPTAPSGAAPSAPAASGLTGDRSVPFTLALDNGMTLQMTASVTADGVLVVSAPDAGGNIDVQQAILIGVQVVRQALNVELSNLSSALFVRN